MVDCYLGRNKKARKGQKMHTVYLIEDEEDLNDEEGSVYILSDN